MRSDDDVRRVFELWSQGLAKKAIARETGVSRGQVRAWLGQGLESTLNSPMRRARVGGSDGPCDGTCGLRFTVNREGYAYVLGMYLGDGCISEGRRGVFRLRIAACDAYPRIREECELAIHLVMPGRKIGAVQREGCTEIYCDAKHWPCVFPQHGAGRKHERPILLSRWQEAIVCAHPGLLLRGLIHSDGWRGINRVTRALKSGPKHYEYPRYLFSNASAHILGIFTHACDLLGVSWRQDGERQISIARRESVERLDYVVGPKS